MKRVPPTAEGLAAAAACLRAGGVVAYPTETVYGLGVDPFNVDAVERLLEAKGRPAGNPFIMIVAETGDADSLCEEPGEDARLLMKAFWPGPLSLILPKHPGLPDVAAGGLGEVAVRCPALEIARDLCRAVGGPLISTSLNRSGEPPALDLDTCVLEGIDLAVDTGALPPAKPSTVYHVAERRVLREGPIGVGAIAAVLAGTYPG
ncbi:MAG: threonylcarbamoyl-AMP synthase [Candidatus Hydrogenedentes bacterium]|nr:threonylcarbamoyl-AMP synthase [Candidatus Hydrogenedentota bacterium]